MKKKIYKNLITTGLKEIKGGKDDLFLGEWCLELKLIDNRVSKIFFHYII